jgi:peptidoglycan/LPS O-acetylase OafA/YrhL
MASNGRNHAIDALRGFSILIVMMLHGAAPIPDFIQSDARLAKFVMNGGYGVSIFFVVSGFLISSNVIKRREKLSRIEIDQFYATRAGRILPNIALFFLVYYALMKSGITDFVPSPPSLFYDGINSLATLQYGNFYLARGNVPGMYAFSPMWSLSIEETFYALFPIACFFLRSDRMIVLAAAILVLIGPFMRPQFPDILLFWGAVDLLAIGCIAAKVVSIVHDREALQALALPLIFSGVAALAICFAYSDIRQDQQWVLSMIGAGTAAILIGVSFDCVIEQLQGWPGAAMSPLSFIGRMSLQLYVFHVMARELFASTLGPYWLFAGLIVMSWALERWFLEPANQRIRAFYRRPAQGIVSGNVGSVAEPLKTIVVRPDWTRTNNS